MHVNRAVQLLSRSLADSTFTFALTPWNGDCRSPLSVGQLSLREMLERIRSLARDASDGPAHYIWADRRP